MKYNLFWNTTWKRKAWLWLVAFVSFGTALLSLDIVPLFKHLDQLERTRKVDLRIAPGEATSPRLGPATDKASNPPRSSRHVQLNVSVAENPVRRLSLTRSPPVDPGVFRNIRPSDKLDREIDNLTVVSVAMF